MSYNKFKELKPDNITSGDSPDYDLDTRKFDTMVIHCADPRFQTAFKNFVTNELNIKQYAPIVLGGAIHPFGSQKTLQVNFEGLYNQIRFFIEEAGLKQLIFINHEDCLWYKGHKEHYPDADLPVKEKEDLVEALKRVHQDFPDVKIRTFWAGLKIDKIYFTEVKS